MSQTGGLLTATDIVRATANAALVLAAATFAVAAVVRAVACGICVDFSLAEQLELDHEVADVQAFVATPRAMFALSRATAKT